MDYFREIRTKDESYRKNNLPSRMRESSYNFLYNQYFAPASNMNEIADATERYISPTICVIKVEKCSISLSIKKGF